MSQISQSSLQFIKQHLKRGIEEYTHILSYVKQYEGEVWSRCDRTKPETATDYIELNRVRNDKRVIENYLTGLIKAQTEIKRAAGSPGFDK